MRNTLALSLRALRRDWRAGELRILVIALVIAVASMTAVGFFTDRVRKAMDQQAAELLAADLVLASSDPIRGERLEQARLLGLRSAETLSFRSVLPSRTLSWTWIPRPCSRRASAHTSPGSGVARTASSGANGAAYEVIYLFKWSDKETSILAES